MSVYCGIDPGNKGAIAFLDTEACRLLIIDMPTEVGRKSNGKTKVRVDPSLVPAILSAGPQFQHAFLESVSSSPQQGVVSAFTFGEGYGILKGALSALGKETHLVSPQLWKARLKVPADKAKAVDRARAIFPKAADLFALVSKDGRAEAALIALYGAFDNHRVPQHPIYPWDASAHPHGLNDPCFIMKWMVRVPGVPPVKR